MATYTFHIDWNNDGDFDDAHEDISAYVMEAEWQIGCAGAGDRVAAPGWLKLTVDNGDGRFSPENASGPLYGDVLPMRAVRVQATHGGTTYTLFTGCLWCVEPEAGARGARRAVLHGVDRVALLDRFPLEMALMEGARADEIVDAIVRKVVWRPALEGYWLLGVTSYAELGQTTRLVNHGLHRSLETGQETFAYAGDAWPPEQTTALDALRETCASEYGRLYCRRDGVVRFVDRHWSQKTHSVALALSDSMSDLAYRRGMRTVYNDIVVQMDPREEGTPGSVLWRNKGGALRLPANSTRTVRAVFMDEEGNRHGAAEATTPAPGIDFGASVGADGSGKVYTSDPRLRVHLSTEAMGAEIAFWWGQVDGVGDPVAEPVYITGLQVRGTPLKAFAASEVAASDAGSVALYQRRRLLFGAPLLNDPVTGHSMARYLLRLHQKASSGVESVTLGGEALRTHILARTLFDVVRVSEAQTGVSTADHFIVAEHHHLAADRQHRCTWRLDPLPPFKAWLLGDTDRSKLGQTTKLGF